MGSKELYKGVKNEFLHNKKALDEVKQVLKGDKDVVSWFYFLKARHEESLGECPWEMWDGGEPDIDERIKLLETALVDGRKIPDKFFTKPKANEVF